MDALGCKVVLEGSLLPAGGSLPTSVKAAATSPPLGSGWEEAAPRQHSALALLTGKGDLGSG